MNSQKLKYKIILIGDSNVGKTSIMNNYFKKYNNLAKNTIGTEYSNIHIKKYNQEFQIWDCAGQERFRSLIKLYYRKSSVGIIVFDLNNIKTLDSVQTYWINNIKENVDDDCIFLLVGNKSDLYINTDYKIIQELCNKYNMEYLECSAKKSYNIDLIFEKISNLLNAKYILDNNNYFNDYNKNLKKENNIKLIENNSLDLYRYNIYSFC